jgi:hypothetical protein
MKTYKEILQESTESQVLKTLSDLIKSDSEAMRLKKIDTLEYLDYILAAYEKEIESTMSRYKLDYDEMAQIIKKVK